MVTPAVLLSRSARQLTKNRRVVVLFIVILILLYLVLNRHPPEPDQREPISIPTHILSTSPSNRSFPFHLTSLADPSASVALPVTRDLDDQRRFFPTHIVQHPTDSSIFYVTNEVADGEVLTLRLARRGSDPYGFEVVGRTESGGREPAFVIVTADGESLLVSNYNSPTVSIYDIPLSTSSLPIPHLVQTLQLPTATKRTHTSSSTTNHHPHQVIQHPCLSALFYLPDLGNGVVWLVERRRRTLRVVDEFFVEVNDRVGKGPRHGVISKDGTTLFLGLQHTSPLLVLTLDPRTGRILPFPRSPVPNSLGTVPQRLLASTPPSSFALSDVQLDPSERYLYVANRRVIGPFQGAVSTERDSIAVFPLLPAHSSQLSNVNNLKRFKTPSKPMAISGPPFYVSTGCWQPRELMPLPNGQLVVSCVGAEGTGGRLVVLDVAGIRDSDDVAGRVAGPRNDQLHKDLVVDRWDGTGSWGILPVHLKKA